MPTTALLAKFWLAGIAASNTRGCLTMNDEAGWPPTVSASAALGTVPSADSLISSPSRVFFFISLPPSDRLSTSTPDSVPLTMLLPVIFRAA